MRDEFKKMYAALNSAQKEAVDAIEGPVMVVAGPGTGKTQILTLRIANILRQTDTDPDSILALTFTESGAYSMRKRLVEIIGSAAYRVTIATFHGFCNDIIRDYPEEFPRIIGANNITEVEQIKILEGIISASPLTTLRPFGDEFYYLPQALSAMNQLKREDVGVAELRQLVAQQKKAFSAIGDLYHVTGPYRDRMKSKYKAREKEIAKNEELCFVYECYEETLEKRRLYDYNDMIREVIRAFEHNKDLLLALQEQYQYILADEHQDANRAQNRILELLCNYYENPNVFIVGDEKQAIFRFQGASLDNFLYFKKLYPGAQLITLGHSYRSTQTILDTADSLIAKNSARIEGVSSRLLAHKGERGEKVAVYEFSKPAVEYYFLARDIAQRIGLGAPAHEIAVLYRDNRDAFAVAEALERAAIPYAIESDQNILADDTIKKLLLLLRVIDNFGSDELLIEALHIDFFDIEALDAYKLIRRAFERRVPVFDLMRGKEALAELALEAPDRIAALYEKLARWKKHSHNRSFTEFFELVVRDSGFLNHVLARSDAIEKMDKLNSLFDEIKASVEAHTHYGLRDFIEYLDMLEAHNVLLRKTVSSSQPRGVRLMTAHKSKGLEFDCIYIINALDGHWGNRRHESGFRLPLAQGDVAAALEAAKNNDDERRLFYVALTRARLQATISFARESQQNREKMPTQFIAEMDPVFLEKKDSSDIEAEFAAQKDIHFAPKALRGASVKDKTFLNELFARQGLSVTALNNYLECPWQYFYQNLLRVPKAPSTHQMYGIAVHEALRAFFNRYKTGEDMSREFFLELFEAHLGGQPLSARDFGEALKKGKRALAGYYDAYYPQWPRAIINEFAVRGIVLAPEIKITGKLDKVELLGEGEVNVVDYKTGKPKSRNFIEGKVQGGTGDYKRQLVFYKLLLNKYAEGKYRMTSGEIDFVEPNERGMYKKERFVIEGQEVAELEALARETAKEILDLAFWDRRCARKDCEFCELREMMK